jgi:hypothetical protein
MRTFLHPRDEIMRMMERICRHRMPMLRELWSTLYAGAGRRRRSADHERVFLQLAGYCLRPGFGYPLDEWRCEQTFRQFATV